MKKALKITGIVLLVLIIVIIAAPFLFEKQMVNYVKKTINANLNATVAFHDADLSFIRSFPQASLKLDKLSVINNAPFEGDTLFAADHIFFNMSLKEIFKSGDEPKKVNEFIINDAYINVVVDSLGNANYDIAIAKDAPAATEAEPSAGFSFDVQHYEINNSKVRYRDASTKMDLLVEDLNHEGTGNFAEEVSTLSTKSSALVSMDFGGSNFLNKTALSLDADLQMDLANQKYTFLENEARINQLPLNFDGFVQVNEDHNIIDISFKTPSSSFKNFLGAMPQEYAQNLDNVETSGDFVVIGKINGRVDEELIPKMDIQISSENASFKYPDLPKSVRNIFINTQIKNDTGIAEDTYVDINKLTFTIDEDKFAAQGNIKNLMGNMLVDMALNGTINLANLKQAYPLEMEQDLNGIVRANMNTSFDMESIEKEQYQNVKASGTASLSNFRYKYEDFPNEIVVSEAKMDFQPNLVNLQKLEAKTGKTDMQFSGKLLNLMGFLFTDQKLKGDFTLNSNTFAVADFMAVEAPAKSSEEKAPSTQGSAASAEAFKLPDFLDVNINFNANRVLYDNLVLENMKGGLTIKDETATLNNVTTNLFDGNVALTGNVSTKQDVPQFDMGLQLNSLNMVSALNNLELFKRLAPVADALQGIMNLKLDINGNLNQDLTPNLQSLGGNALAQIVQAQVKPNQSQLISKFDERLDFVDLNNLSLKDLSTYLVFNNGAVEVKPFDFKIKDINVTASGNHNFDMNMNYNLNLDIPAKYLGKDVGNIITRLSAQEAEQMTVQLPVGLTGTFQTPKINVNTQQAVTSLTNRIIEKQKGELKDKGKDLLNDILGGNKNNTQDTTGTKTNTPRVEEQVKEQVKDKVKDILGGFGKKKN